MIKKRILIVEDEPIIAEDLRYTLETIGYEVIGVIASGHCAADAVREHAPDAVLMDIVLRDGSDGIESTKQIQKDFDVPIVYLTAHADTSTFERAQETCPFGYLVKPVGASELFSSIETSIHRHRLEKKLKESEQRYRLLSELVSDGASSVRVEPDGSFFVEWSTNYFRARLGYSAEELASLESWARVVHRDDTPLFLRCIDLLRRGEQVSDDLRIIAKNGAVRWVHATIYPEWDASEHRLCRIITAIQDITARKVAEEALRKNEERLLLIANNMQDIICQVDRAGEIVYLSPSYLQITGFSSGEKIGSNIFDGIHEDDIPAIMESVRESISGKKAGRIQYRYQHRDGHYIWLEVNGKLILDEREEVTGAVFVARDISDRMRLKGTPGESESTFK